MWQEKGLAARDLLISTLRERLVPVLKNMGFEAIPLLADEKRSREILFSFPLGRLRRIKEDGSFELVEIQLDKHGSARFRLNLGVIPRAGIDHPVKHVEQEEAAVGFLSFYAELYSSPFFRKWFSVGSRVSPADLDRQVRELVERVIAIVPEVDAWFLNGEVGRHVRQVRTRNRASDIHRS